MLLFLIQVAQAITFSRDVASQIFESGKPALILFYENSHQDQLIEFKKVKNQELLLVEANNSDKSVKKLIQILQIHQLPAIKLLKCEGTTWQDVQTINYDDQILNDKLNKFIARYQDGQLFYDIQSEDVPGRQMEEGIEIVVGHNYDEHVQDTNRHYLIYFYSQDCDLCQSMLQNLVRLNNQVRTGKTSIKPNQMRIGKINGELNKIHGLKVNKYPSLYLYKMNDKAPIEYKGDRTSEGMLMWIENMNK
ncbi:unnamed protein product (macronuclear) [Paramecium tetraurelia]|uniref:protein disulfide-isomerase n=1 Tax=Paramecium tetraurelia TaxID=5888 RepID=A0DW20_PARTE|nr:uncharacterized protein GSPATT00020890001 [Paramecium tetraurelia]CAK87237.1 unnamed protein product [Paramecium tetraurelia]|eukprot:XP_001454634.1 hypothetical protein (macronuclear) [Paramecium tetraurelia strain d4-2]